MQMARNDVGGNTLTNTPYSMYYGMMMSTPLTKVEVSTIIPRQKGVNIALVGGYLETMSLPGAIGNPVMN